MVSVINDELTRVKDDPELSLSGFTTPVKNETDHDFKSDLKLSNQLETSIKSEIEQLKLENSGSDSGNATTPEYDESRKIKQSRMKRQSLKDTPRQLFNELPSVTDEALKAFTLLTENVYTLKNLGDSGQEEFMSCDCKPDYADSSKTGINHACDEDSDCINRLTSIECLMDSSNHHNNCGKECSNQRMQRCQYATVDVIQTAQKGFGLRALNDIPANTFIYEYIGEIINQDRFVKRTQAYQQQGVKHFYFMMLQKNEFIDATQKGCLARFCNHSCNPNSYVDKWIVGSKLRMGIFAKRTISKGEEITFDYNVDRYGADAQKCYCGEPNCIGYLGGKTQTDSVNRLPQMIIDALGLTESDEKLFIKKKISVIKEYQTLQATQQSAGGASSQQQQQQQQLSQETLDKIYDDLLPIKAIHEDSVSRTMGSLIQCKDAWLVRKLVKRIFITDDTSIHLKVIRMHGYEIFSKLLRNWSQADSLNENIIIMILRILKKWPKMTKNKISSSKIEDIVKSFAVEFKPKVKEEDIKNEDEEDIKNEDEEDIKNEDEEDIKNEDEEDKSQVIYTLAQELIEDWSNLQMAYRIPRRERSSAQISSMAETAGPDNGLDESLTETNGSNNSTRAGTGTSTPTVELSSSSPSVSAFSNSMQNIPTGPRASKNNKGNPSMDSMGLLSRGDPSSFIGSNVPTGPKLPPGWERAISDDNRVYYCHTETGQTQWEFPTAFSSKKANNKSSRYDERNNQKNNSNDNNEDMAAKTASQQQTDLQKIIEEANMQVALKAQLATLALKKQQKEDQEKRKKVKLDLQRQKERERNGGKDASSSSRHRDGSLSATSSAASSSSSPLTTTSTFSSSASSTKSSSSSLSSSLTPTELAYTKLFARYVPNFIKKYEAQLSHEVVKRHAKDIVKVLASKEIKTSGTLNKKIPKSFDEKKLLKIKHFSREYMEKVMKHQLNKQQGSKQGASSSPSSSSTGGGSAATPTAVVATLTLSSDGDASGSNSQASTRAPTPLPIGKRENESEVDNNNNNNNNNDVDGHSPAFKLPKMDHGDDVKTQNNNTQTTPVQSIIETQDKDDNEIDFDD